MIINPLLSLDFAARQGKDRQYASIWAPIANDSRPIIFGQAVIRWPIGKARSGQPHGSWVRRSGLPLAIPKL